MNRCMLSRGCSRFVVLKVSGTCLSPPIEPINCRMGLENRICNEPVFDGESASDDNEGV